MKPWFEVKAAEDGSAADIYVYGFIGGCIDDMWGDPSAYGITTAKSFVDALAALPESVKTLKVRINSPGGDVFGGVTIANTLRAERAKGRKVETIVEGLAASAASVIAMGGSPVRIGDNAMMMVHSPWTVGVGNAKDLRATADILDQVRDTLVKTYQWHSEMSDEELLALIDGEDGQGTWLDADGAIDAGLADEKVEGLKAAASIDPKAAAKLKVPEQFAARVAALLAQPVEDAVPPAPAPEPKAEPMDAAAVVAACAHAGLDIAFASGLIGQRLSAGAVPERIAAEKAARAAAVARENEIRAACALVKQDDLAPGYVAGGMTVAQVNDQLAIITAKLDKADIDAGLTPDHGTSRKPVIDTVAVYRRLNSPAATKH